MVSETTDSYNFLNMGPPPPPFMHNCRGKSSPTPSLNHSTKRSTLSALTITRNVGAQNLAVSKVPCLLVIQAMGGAAHASLVVS